MGQHIHSRWVSRFVGMSRRDRRGCDYDAFVPDPLAGCSFPVDADIAADVADAETAIRDLNHAGTTHVSLEGLARFLLRAESVASSRIEGLVAGPRRLIGAEVALAEGHDAADQAAVEVLGNITAMHEAVDTASTAEAFGLDDLLAVHRTLMLRSANPG